MAFFQQLKLLLWKNGLTVIRQPLWSLTLICWPLIIFIIIAVTRMQFPPVLKETCFVGPRNLPSAGFFPFLQTLMCTTDSNCKNKSHLVDPAATKVSGSRRSNALRGSPLADLIQGDFPKITFPSDAFSDPAALIGFFNNILDPNYRGRPHNVSLMNTTNTNLLGDKEALNTTLESMNLLKRAFCNMTLPMMNITSPNHLSQTVVNFCNTNETLLEVSLHTLNQILMELMMTKPDEAVTMAGMSLLVFDQLQNQTSLWESLLAIPQLLYSGSVDEALETIEALLTNVHGALRVIESNFPEASAPLSTVHPLFVGSIDLVHYVQKWPGKDVAISLEEIVTLQNDSLSEMVRFILREVQIPLDKAIGLALDRDMVHRYICDNSSKPMWLTGACSTGAVRMILGWINPNSVAQQTLLAWSRHVAAQDVSFAKGLLHSLMGGFPPGGQGGANITRTRRSVETQPQNIEEELFLGVGQVAMEIIKLVPQVDMVVETILRTGFQSMKSASVTMQTVQDMIVEVISDADQLKQTYLNLLTNQSEASVFIGHVLDSGMEVIMKGLATENLTCEEILDPFEQFLKTKSIKIEVWRSAICQNGSALQQALLMDWSTVAEKAQELYSTITGQADYNITLPMILSEWHKLYNNSLQFGMIAGRLAMELGGAYWTNWMPDNSTHDVTGTLQQSVFFSMVRLGERFEQTPLWPLVRNYFHIAYWILNYRPDVTTQPANCFVNISTSAIQCKTDLNWPRFVQAMTQALMSPNPDILVNCLKGTVNLLQHVYSDIYKQLAKSVLKQEIQGGDALAAYLTNLIFNLDDFVQKISVLSNQNISIPDVTLPLVANLLQPTGLTPLLPLFTGNTTTNFSTVLDVALKVSRLNQHIFTFNETDPTMPELEHLLTQFLTLEGNLTMSLSHIMGNTLLTYSGYFHPEDVARLREAIKPFTNQTSTGFVEAILHAMELLKEVMDSPNGNPTNIILGYIRQLQEFMMSLYRLQRIQHVTLPNGQLSPAQITELNKVSDDFLNLLTAEGIEDLTQAGPDIAQDIIAKKFVAFLPPEVQDEATRFLRDFRVLQSEITKCAAGQNCLTEISEVFIFLDQITRVILSTNGNVTINVAAPNSVLLRQESDEIASAIFSLVLSSNDSAYVETFRQILNFIRLVSTMPNITVSDAQNALRQFNLTLADLNNIAALTGAANLNDLMVKLMDIINARQCLVPNHNQTVTVQCVMGSVKAVSNFLTNVPALRNEAAILSLIPLIVNKTVSDVVQVDFSSNPHMAIIDTLSSTLANVKMSLQLNNLNTPEVMKEMRVLEGLIQLAANTEPLSHLNSTLMMNPTHAQLVYLKIVDWYLNRFVNITSQSSFSELFHPFFLMTQMQVTLQLAQTNLSLFVANQVESLLKTLQYPIDGAGIVKIGHTAVEILRQQFEFIKLNLEVQNNVSAPMQIFNTTILSAAEFQVKQYLDLIQNWMKQPNVSPVLTSMLQWGSPSINISSPLTDIHQLLGTVVNFLTRDQMVYVSMISNVTQSLNKALMVAEQPGGLQSDHFLAAISDAVQNAMQILTQVTGPLPPSVQQNILEIAKDSIKLIVQPDMGFASSRMTSLVILRRAESVIRQTVPEMFAVYLLSGIKVVTTYFETISTAFGQDNWNQLILNEMQTLQSLLPPNSTVQSYVSVLINITSFVLESDQGIMNIWAGFGNATVENVSLITGQVGKLLSTVWPLIMGGLGSHATPPSPQQFAHLAPVLEQLMTGKASKDTWNKLEKMLEIVLSTLKGTQMWNNISAVVPLFEKIIKTTVKQMQAENVLILSFQTPVVTLMREIAQSANTSRFNLSQVSERMPLAIERTMQAAQQANGTLECHGLLKAWQPVREAAGLSHDTLATWCNVSLQPVMEAYTAAETIYTHLNMSNVGVEPLMANATAARIIKTVQSFYRVNINRTLLTQQLIMTFSGQFSSLAGQPLSPEAQLYWYNQLETMQLQNSLSSIKMLSAELLNVAPYLQPYIRAMERALSHILDNYHLTQNSNSAQHLFTEAASIILSSANITSFDLYPMIWGNFSGVNEASVAGTITNAVKAMIDMKMFGSAPAVYQALGQILASNETSLILQKVTEISAWLASTQVSGLDLLTQALPKIHEILRPLLSALTQMSVDMPANMELFGDLAESLIAIIGQLVNTSGPQAPMRHPLGMSHQAMTNGNHTVRGRHRREAPTMPPRYLIDDFMDLLYIDYPVMFQALSVLPTQEEMMETVHVFFANPDLNIVVKGVTRDMTWGLNASREETIDAALGMLSILTLPGAFQTSSLDLLANAAHMLPDGFPFSALLKNLTRVVADESHEILILMQNVVQTAGELLQINMTDPRFAEKLDYMKSQVCTLESSQSMHLLMVTLSMEPGQLCSTVLPSLETLIESLMMNVTILTDAIFEAVIGDPRTYKVQLDWMSALSQSFNFSSSSVRSLKMNTTSPGPVTVGEILRNETAFILDVQQHMDLDPAALRLLLGATLPNSNLVILSWVTNLHHCDSATFANMKETDAALLKIFCSMSPEQWYSFLLLLAQHLNVEKAIYRMVLSEELQGVVAAFLRMAEVITDTMNKFLPAINQLQQHLMSISDLNLVANDEFNEMTRGQRSSISSKSAFVTLSRALCSKGILALFGISQLPIVKETDHSLPEDHHREEMITRFKIPPDASPFCTNMYLDMVNTTGGAIAWAFLKPMLMGHILYSPDTPVTRAIMEKANTTLQQFANLRDRSEEWLESSKNIVDSAQILSDTMPMLQNSLGNSFVKNFIEMQTDINVGKMKETLSNFSNMTDLLKKNKHVLKQIDTLSTLMVDLSSCIKFDRYRGYDSEEELNAVAQELAKNRDLYASVIFKLSDNDDPSRKRQTRSSSSVPPKVSYTIRMHMDNVMRTDRVRNPYFVKDNNIWTGHTMRYNRGFIYLQENIDRAIIETQTGHRVTEPAVQLQPFPYPCHHRDEYLEAISFVFPLMLMMAWVLFVADFVKKLVHERELRLHEYMKMMGVNPLSHFFAWFVECATYLVLTIFILTLVLKYGNILPSSDGFLLFLYFCDYGLSVLAFSFLVSSFFDKTYIAGLSGSLIYVLCFFPFIVVMAGETKLNFSQKSALSLFSPTCFSYASQYISRYEAQGEGIHWSNSYTSPIAEDTASFGWLCWLMLIDSFLYFIVGAYIRMVFPGKYGIPAPWYFPFTASFWADLCCCIKPSSKVGRGLFFSNIMQKNHPVFFDDKGKGQSTLSSQAGEDFSHLPMGVALHGLSKIYGERQAIENLNVSFYEGHVTSLLGHNGAGKTTTMSLLTGLYAPSSGSIEVYGQDMQANIEDIRKELGVCMQYDVLFDHMTTKEHLLLYGQIKAPHWSHKELREQVRTILEETGMYAHRHKRVGTLSGGMKRKLSISIAFIGGSRLVVLDEPTTGVDPCSRRSIWDIIIQHKKNRTIIMSTHHLDEAEVLSDRIAFLERGGLKCCGSPFYLKDKLGHGYKLTLTRKMQNAESDQIDSCELKSFIQAHVPEARLKEAQGGDVVYSLPPFSSSNASSYRSLLTALDANLDALQLGGYGISDTTLEEVFLQLAHSNTGAEDGPLTISETVSDTDSMDSQSISNFGDKIKLTGSSLVSGLTLAWQQMTAILIKRFHHSRRDWKGLIAQILLPVVFVICAMGLGSIKSDLRHYPELVLSPALYKFRPSYSFFSNQNPNSSRLTDAMMSFPGIDNACLDKSDNPVCTRNTKKWSSRGNSSKKFSVCKCTSHEQICGENSYEPPHKEIPSAQVLYNLSGVNVENYLVATANNFIRNRYGGFSFGMPLPDDLQMDVTAVPKNRTLSKVWFNPEGHHTMPAYLNSLNNLILRSNLPADKDPREYAISVSSHPYFGREDDEDTIVQGMLQIMVVMCVLTGYSITTASFAIYEVNEHHSGSKRLQHIAGVGEPFYWAVNFLYDMAIYMFPVTLTIAVAAIFQLPAFTDRQNLGAVALLLVLFGFATFPWMYLLSGIFRDAEMAFITYVCINLFISMNTILSTSILYFLGQISASNSEAIQEVFKKLCYTFHIFPQFNFGNGLMTLARKNIEVQLLSGYGVDAYQNPFSLDGLGGMFISSFILGLVFFTLRILLNKYLMRKVWRLICGRKTVPQVSLEDEDEDVATEHLRVSSGAASSDVLQVNQLTKVYQHLNKKVHAVKRLSVGIPAGECFGLLGVNGAGKTTTFKMLTGDVSPTDGTAQIRERDGHLVDIMECRDKGINIGYCPQVDALDSLLTGEEHLYFYGRIRGISKRELDGVVNYLLRRMELNYHRNIITDGYSCGTRRKLSTALALIGHPQILLLDEPSSGMDPRTKRHLWKIISEEVKGKCAVVLTSHSMEECEALCSRLAIMVKGQFRCLGSLQHIKNRFGSGFTVKMYLAKSSCDTEAITGFMQHRFPSTYLKDQHSSMVEYHVPVAPGGVADIFDQLESNKNALQIKHFSVSQTTLDEVFINFAMGNNDKETTEEESNNLGSIKAVET